MSPAGLFSNKASRFKDNEIIKIITLDKRDIHVIFF